MKKACVGVYQLLSAFGLGGSGGGILGANVGEGGVVSFTEVYMDKRNAYFSYTVSRCCCENNK